MVGFYKQKILLTKHLGERPRVWVSSTASCLRIPVWPQDLPNPFASALRQMLCPAGFPNHPPPSLTVPKDRLGYH